MKHKEALYTVNTLSAKRYLIDDEDRQEILEKQRGLISFYDHAQKKVIILNCDYIIDIIPYENI